MKHGVITRSQGPDHENTLRQQGVEHVEHGCFSPIFGRGESGHFGVHIRRNAIKAPETAEFRRIREGYFAPNPAIARSIRTKWRLKMSGFFWDAYTPGFWPE